MPAVLEVAVLRERCDELRQRKPSPWRHRQLDGAWRGVAPLCAAGFSRGVGPKPAGQLSAECLSRS